MYVLNLNMQYINAAETTFTNSDGVASKHKVNKLFEMSVLCSMINNVKVGLLFTILH